MTERIFQKKLIAELRRNFFHVLDLSNNVNEPGCPDLLVSKSGRHVFFELKIIPSVESNKRFIDIFTEDQFPFYRKYFLCGCNNIYIIAWSNKEKIVSYYRMRKESLTPYSTIKGIFYFSEKYSRKEFCHKPLQQLFGFERRSEV